MTYAEFKAKYPVYFKHPMMQGEDYHRCNNCNLLYSTSSADSKPGEIERLDHDFGTDYFQEDDILICGKCRSDLEINVIPDAEEIEEIKYLNTYWAPQA
jgi:hypothetical protein